MTRSVAERKCCMYYDIAGDCAALFYDFFLNATHNESCRLLSVSISSHIDSYFMRMYGKSYLT